MTLFLSRATRKLSNVVRRARSNPLQTKFQRSLSTRIGFGYVVAIGIGVVGSFAGVLIADIVQGINVEKLFLVQEQSTRLDNLQASVARAKVKALRLNLFLDNPDERQERLGRFDRAMSAAVAQVNETQAWTETLPDWLVLEEPNMLAVLDGYATVLTNYQVSLLALLESAETGSGTIAAELQMDLNRLHKDESLEQLDIYHQKLEGLRDRARTRERARSEAMETIQGFEKFAIFLSVTVSGAIAGVIAMRTTREIVTPIAQTAAIAEQAAREADYSLRAPIVTQDELAQLSTSLNYLIERVGRRTQELHESERAAHERSETLQATLAELADTQSQLV